MFLLTNRVTPGSDDLKRGISDAVRSGPVRLCQRAVLRDGGHRQPRDHRRGDSQRGDARGGAVYKLNPVDPLLESAWFQPLNL